MTVDEDGPAQLRVQLRSSADPRVARTRARLFGAIRQLSGDGRGVTVSSVADAAGVSRSVFYTHFEDLADLALQLLEPHFAAIAAYVQGQAQVEPHAAMLDAQRRLVAVFVENRTLFAAVLGAERTRAVVTDGLRRAIETALARRMDRIGGVPAPLRADVAAAYVSAASTHVLVAWLVGDLALDEEALAQHLFALMPAWLHAGPTTPSLSTVHEEESP
ncbi:MAG: TetR family transcriptional regulator [Actinobacteria bacterium]|nr:TetR family transcriptional regulator [Actinomycetota bacterium]